MTVASEGPCYLIIDPVGPYPQRFVEALAERGHQGIAAFSTPMRGQIWLHRGVRELGDFIVDSFIPEEDPPDVPALAQRIEAVWGGRLRGLVPWDEISIRFGAALGDALGLGWNSSQVIERCRDKLAMKAWLREHVPVRMNASRVVETADQARRFQREVGSWPIVVKPTGGAGSMHVYFADSDGQLLHSCQQVLENGEGQVLLEEYIDGPELAVNGAIDSEGGFLVTDVWRYDKRFSHGYPNLYYQTIKLGSDEPIFVDVAEYAGAVVQGLGLRRAPVHMEVKVDDRGPCLIEVGARFAGGHQPSLASELHARDLFALAGELYLGERELSVEDVDFERYDQLEARILSGIQSEEIVVRHLHGQREVESLPSFYGWGHMARPGQRLRVTKDLDTKSYELYLVHRDGRQLARDAQAVRALLHYEG